MMSGSGIEGERRRYWQRIMARNQIESCWCRKVPRAGYMCDDCFRAFRDERPNPQGATMTTNLKPLLTRKHVAAFVDMECDCTDPRCKFEESACRTIKRMAELLERTLPFLQSTSVSLYYDINILLSTFNATGGEGS